MVNSMVDTSIIRRVIEHKAMIDSAKKDIANMSYAISTKSDSLKELNNLKNISEFSFNYLDVLVKEESGKFIKHLNNILDFGVKSIFDDCNYSIEIRVSDSSKATIHLVYDDENGVKLEPDIKNCGGGIRTVVGCLSQIAFITHYRLEPVLFIDEGLSQLSSQYIPNFMELINQMAEKNGLKILLITHDDRFTSYAVRHYEVSKGNTKLLRGGELGE
jgi:hypothetical protein